MRAFSALLLQTSTQKRTIPTNERKWKVIHAHSPDGGDLANAVSKMVTKRFVITTKMNDNLAVQCIDTVRLVLLRAFAHQVARYFSEKLWKHLIQEGSSKKRLENCLDCKISLRYLRAIQGHCGGISKRPGLMEYTLIPHNYKKYIFHRGISWNSQSFCWEWNNSRRKRE